MSLLQRDVEMQFLQTHFSQPVKQMYLFVLCCNNASCIQSTEKLQAINLLPQLGGVGMGGGSKQERRQAIKIHQNNVGMRRAQIDHWKGQSGVSGHPDVPGLGFTADATGYTKNLKRKQCHLKVVSFMAGNPRANCLVSRNFYLFKVIDLLGW